MIIISHRGYWKDVSEKNTKIAFERSFSLGFGTETDVRDYCGKLVISHDIADNNSILFDDFLKLYSSHDKNLFLALNVKADGLIDKLKESLEKYGITKYFFFDMSVPQQILYVKASLPTFTRHSEYEQHPTLYDECNGVWVDCFKNEWFDEKTLKKHLDSGKIVCIVSPDLHKREYLSFWKKLSKMKIVDDDNLILCTDFPEEAKGFFYGEN